MSDDPIAKAIESLPDEPIAPKLAADVLRKARLSLEAEKSAISRLDHFLMDKLMPAALSAVVVWYGFGLVDFFERTYGSSAPENRSAAAEVEVPGELVEHPVEIAVVE